MSQPCDCKVKSVRFSPGNPDGQFEVVYCPLHVAAPKMLEELREALLWWHHRQDITRKHPQPTEPTWVTGARALVAKIEGRT